MYKEGNDLTRETPGVVITLREIYDSVQGVGDSLERMEGKLLHLEEKTLLAVKADERSQNALDMAKEAYRLAEESNEAIESYQQSKEDQKQWYSRTIIAAVIPYIISAIIGLLYILGK